MSADSALSFPTPTAASSRPHPVDDTSITKPLVKGLRRQAAQLAETIDRPDADRVAAAWVYTSVLVAWAEDHGLVPVWLRADAERRRKEFVARPGGSMRLWLGRAFASLTTHPATECLLDPRYNPVTAGMPSEDACRALVEWWSAEAPDLAYQHDGPGPASITGWLAGDLLQLVNEERSKGNALCQTPWWVADFLCELTLAPAAQEFLPHVDVLRVIDPACGTGHILTWVALGLHKIYTQHFGVSPVAAVHRVLAGVHGVELDPLTAAVARLRLLVTAGAMLANAGALPGPLRLSTLPRNLRPRIAVGNSLLAGQGDPHPPGTILDDTAAYPGILTRDSYHAVIANPPYIVVKDPATNAAIRAAYPQVCTGQYSLAVPFTKLLFDLAVRPGSVSIAPAKAIQDALFDLREGAA